MPAENLPKPHLPSSASIRMLEQCGTQRQNNAFATLAPGAGTIKALRGRSSGCALLPICGAKWEQDPAPIWSLLLLSPYQGLTGGGGPGGGNVSGWWRGGSAGLPLEGGPLMAECPEAAPPLLL